MQEIKSTLKNKYLLWYRYSVSSYVIKFKHTPLLITSFVFHALDAKIYNIAGTIYHSIDWDLPSFAFVQTLQWPWGPLFCYGRGQGHWLCVVWRGAPETRHLTGGCGRDSGCSGLAGNLHHRCEHAHCTGFFFFMRLRLSLLFV